MNNTTLYFILTTVFAFLSYIFGIWVIVEFILYLVKDNPFNWWSLYLALITTVIQLFFMIKTISND